jgi:mannose-6-phosphate isomerase-like protein (cupin superfamily)
VSIAPESLAAHRARLTEPWKPIEIARMNDSVVRMALMHGEFPWHHHAEDEMFLAYEGEFDLETARGTVHLRAGEYFVVPAGLEHRPVAATPAVTLLVELASTKQYGEQPPR